jgi:phospholipid/cholesterol/gamma-HCH transport system substrate-binding protein
MNRHERGLEFKVGAFVFVGLLMLAALVVQFGRLGEGFKSYYPITVRFTDASGLLKDSNVLLAGARIGHVAGGPQLVREGHGVAVPLRIYDYVKIPKASKFEVGSSGLLGDRFVSVTLPPGQPTDFLPKGAEVEGARQTGMDDLTREGGALVVDMRKAVQNIDETVVRLNHQALSEANLENLRASVEHLNAATGALAESSKKLDGVLAKADSTMSSANKAADDLQRVMTDARKTAQAATQVLHEAIEGKGLLGTLIGDKALADNLRALVSNLRKHGVLFYRDSAVKADTTGGEQTKPGRRGGERP